jgi:hypothetical protein
MPVLATVEQANATVLDAASPALELTGSVGEVTGLGEVGAPIVQLTTPTLATADAIAKTAQPIVATTTLALESATASALEPAKPTTGPTTPEPVSTLATPPEPAGRPATAAAVSAVTARTSPLVFGIVSPPTLPAPSYATTSTDGGSAASASRAPRAPTTPTPGGPLGILSTAFASGTGGGALFVFLLAALAAALHLAAPGLGRRLRSALAPWPLPILELSLERPG